MLPAESEFHRVLLQGAAGDRDAVPGVFWRAGVVPYSSHRFPGTLLAIMSCWRSHPETSKSTETLTLRGGASSKSSKTLARPCQCSEDCASTLWAGLAADAAPIHLPRHSQQERVAPQLQLLQSARGIFDQQPRGAQAAHQRLAAGLSAIQHLRSRSQGQLQEIALGVGVEVPKRGLGSQPVERLRPKIVSGSVVISRHPSFVR